MQGESGVRPAERAFLEEARRLCDKHGALLIFDEIQCGMGRLGTLFAFQTFGVRPDVVTIAKALSNGLPIGAVLIDAKASSALQPGDHGTTFGGSPVPAAAALAHLRVRDEVGLDAHVRAVGRRLHDGLSAVADRFRATFEPPRGIGLMLGLPVRAPHAAKSFVDRARDDHRLLLNAAGDNTLRFVPPLVISPVEVDEVLVRFGKTIESLIAP